MRLVLNLQSLQQVGSHKQLWLLSLCFQDKRYFNGCAKAFVRRSWILAVSFHALISV